MGKHFNILVVDDSPKNIQLGVSILKQNPEYHLIFATSGEQALTRIKERPFDLVLLDIMMPEMDGFDVCKILKNDPATKDIPVIFLTAKTDPDSIVKGFEMGGVDYVTKPFNSHELLSRVRTQLELKYYYEKEIDRRESQLRQAQRMEAVGILAGGIAHNFNNVLGTIIGTVDYIRHSLRLQAMDPATLDRKLESVAFAGNRATRIVKTLMDLARPEDTDFTIIDMNDAVNNVLRICSNSMSKAITIHVNFPETAAMISADISQIEQAVLNLAINAEHAMTLMRTDDPFSGGTLTVTISPETLSRHGDEELYWVLSVSDTGVGMTPEILSQIFEPFYTQKTGKIGTGLGLAVTKNIIEKHGGFIKAESVPGEGSTIQMWMPAIPCSSGGGQNDLPECSAPMGSVVVVDEDIHMAQTAGDILTVCGYDLVASGTLPDVFEAMGTHPSPDAALVCASCRENENTDIALKVKEKWPGVKLLIATDIDADPVATQHMDAGGADIILKPYTLKELTRKMNGLLKQS